MHTLQTNLLMQRNRNVRTTGEMRHFAGANARSIPGATERAIYLPALQQDFSLLRLSSPSTNLPRLPSVLKLTQLALVQSSFSSVESIRC